MRRGTKQGPRRHVAADPRDGRHQDSVGTLSAFAKAADAPLVKEVIPRACRQTSSSKVRWVLEPPQAAMRGHLIRQRPKSSFGGGEDIMERN